MSGPFGSSQWMYNSGIDYEIGQSVRFEDGDSATFSRTLSASNTKLWTFSTWFKFGNIKQQSIIMCPLGSGYSRIEFDGGSFAFLQYNGSAYDFNVTETAKRRDTSAWYHIVVVYDSAQGTDSNRIKLYVNGSQVTSFSNSDYPSSNLVTPINGNVLHTIGWTTVYGASHYMDGYLAETNFIDGIAKAPADFGETGIYGEWKPIEYGGDYGTNGFYLNFATAGDMGDDKSSNTNDFAENNIVATDQMLDSPTNNFATYNPLHRRANLGNPTYSEGNLKIVHPNLSGNASYGVSSIGVDSGKYYCEILALDFVTNFSIGIATMLQWNGDGNRNSFIAYKNDGNVKKYTNVSSAEATYTDGDIIGIAFDIDNKTVAFYKNNALQHTVTDIDAGFEDTYHVLIQASTNDTHVANFGQDSSFAGNKTAQGNSDGNGIGDFFYAPPSGFLALCTKNLPTPVIVPSQHFNTVLWTGTGSSNSITGVGFQPNLVWLKERGGTSAHYVTNDIDGTVRHMQSNTTEAEGTDAQLVSTYGTDGFTVGTSGGSNQNGIAMVAWNWKAGNATLASNAFTQGSLASTCSRNVDAGFSIVSWTGNDQTGTIGHGLSKAPELILLKGRNIVKNWVVYHASNTSAPETDFLTLNTTAATEDFDMWQDTAPTATVFSVSANDQVNNSSSTTYIGYCFHSVEGYSKVGSYTGNGNADGTFVYTGFRPAFVMVKASSRASSWLMLDSDRNLYNPTNNNLRANENIAAFDSGSGVADFLSNGFKPRSTDSSYNGSGSNYIYMAFAEEPLVGDNPATAR